MLAEFDLTQAQTFELAKAAADVARAACKKHSTLDKPRFVIGSMGPGTKLITLGNTDWATMFDSYREQVRGCLRANRAVGQGGRGCAHHRNVPGHLAGENARSTPALVPLKERGLSTDDVPIMASVTIETTGTMLVGTSIEAAATRSRDIRSSLGLNYAQLARRKWLSTSTGSVSISAATGDWFRSCPMRACRCSSTLPH